MALASFYLKSVELLVLPVGRSYRDRLANSEVGVPSDKLFNSFEEVPLDELEGEVTLGVLFDALKGSFSIT